MSLTVHHVMQMLHCIQWHAGGLVLDLIQRTVVGQPAQNQPGSAAAAVVVQCKRFVMERPSAAASTAWHGRLASVVDKSYHDVCLPHDVGTIRNCLGLWLSSFLRDASMERVPHTPSASS